MLYSKITTIILLFTFSYSFSQESERKSTIMKQIEGITVSYEKVNHKSDYIFHIDNQSGNSAILSWDAKIYYSETDSKEIHKEYTSIAFTKVDKSLLEESKANYNNKTTIQGKPILKLEIHNFKFKSAH